jgi:hypothetical protein
VSAIAGAEADGFPVAGFVAGGLISTSNSSKLSFAFWKFRNSANYHFSTTGFAPLA